MRRRETGMWKSWSTEKIPVSGSSERKHVKCRFRGSDLVPRVEVTVQEERKRERDLKCGGREAKMGPL